MIALIAEALGLLKSLVDASGNGDEELQALLKMQRLISDEIAKRELQP